MLILKNINKNYFKKVIDNFSYEFKKGKIYCIIGPSGCGKSTLLSIISNKTKKYYGKVIYKSIDIKKQKNYSFNEISYVFQNYQLFDDLTAYENVVLHFYLTNKDINGYYYKIKRLFDYFKISHLMNIKAKDLSGGEKQRVALIKAFLKDSSILLLDEPTSALDEKTTELVFQYLNKIKQNKIIIMVTHDNNLAKRSDEIIDLSKKYIVPISKIKLISNKEKKIKFYKLKWIYKKVFENKKIFNYISTTILTFGLISLSLSSIISSFINDVLAKTFHNMLIENQMTFKAKNYDPIIDFSKGIEGFDVIYYEGFESNFKTTIKENSYIDYVDFNYYDIGNINFVFDNYLSKHNENMVLYIPSFANEYILDENYLNIYYMDKQLNIKIDMVYQSNDENFYIHCNNISYLQPYFKEIGINYTISSFLHCLKAEKLYKYLMTSSYYQNYMFLLDKKNNVIKIIKSDYSRISKQSLDEFIKANNLNNYLVSDFKNTFIDYDSGFIYLLFNEEAIQIVIDENISDGYINITKKLNKKIHINLKIKDVNLIVNHVIDDNMYEVIYMNTNTFKNINEEIVYAGIIYDCLDIKATNNIMVNDTLFDINSFQVFTYISNFLLYFALIILILAIITTLTIFTINFLSKKKDIILLSDFGIYKHKIIQILLYDTIKNIFSSIISTIIASLFSLFLISIIYKQINGSDIQISISISLFASIIILPFVIILPFIILKIINFFKKNYQK